jgi:TonB family protein
MHARQNLRLECPVFRYMLRRVVLLLIVLRVLYCGASTDVDVQKEADEMLDRARQLSDIRSSNAPGFRLDLTFSFIGKDLETTQGTYIEVWVSNSKWRKETVVGNLRRLEIGGANRHWLIDNQDLPEEATRVSAMVEMLPSSTAKIEFESFTEPDPTTQCAVTKAQGEKQQRQAFCFDKGNHFLVARVDPTVVGQQIADYSCNYGEFQKFGHYWFPHEMTCFRDGHKKMDAKVAQLAPEASTNAALFAPPRGAAEIGTCSVNPVPPQPVTTPLPSSPLGMRDRQSSVALWMVVDTKGKPQNLKISRSGGKQFDESALTTVRGWRFKPGTCNGEPIPMPINLEVPFRQYQ